MVQPPPPPAAPAPSPAAGPPSGPVPARERLLTAASRLVEESRGEPVSTRAVCTAAGVGAPTLYHHFGDKEGLLDAVLLDAFARYRADRAAAQPPEDPVEGIRREWDAQLRFALAHPGLHVLLHGGARPRAAAAAEQAAAPLLAALHRAAAAGRLRKSPEAAAELVTAACVGVAATLLGSGAAHQEPSGAPGEEPPGRPEPELPAAAREAVIAAVVSAPPDGAEPGRTALASRAIAMREALAAGAPGLTANETALLRDWLERVAER